jgi:DDE_Tnp_1-associated
MLEALITEFEAIEDPRCAWKVEHRLVDILVIAVCAVIGEAESFEDIALYAGPTHEINAINAQGVVREGRGVTPAGSMHLRLPN